MGLSNEIRGPLKKSTRTQYEGFLQKFGEWCESRGYVAFPASSHMLEEYVWWLGLSEKWGGGVRRLTAVIRRRAVERKEYVPDVPRDAVVVAMKKGRKMSEVRPYV